MADYPPSCGLETERQAPVCRSFLLFTIILMHFPKVRRGEEHPNAKLTRAQIDAYRERKEAGESYRALGREAGVSHHTVADAVERRTYRDTS